MCKSVVGPVVYCTVLYCTVRTERVDAVAESQQTAVDVCSLDHPLAAVLRVGGAL